MKGFLRLVGVVFLIQGVGGAVNNLLGWWRWAHDLLLVNRLEFLRGYEVAVGAVIAAIGFALYALGAESGKAVRKEEPS